METKMQQHEVLENNSDIYRCKLKTQITEMRRTIEDLKQKVIEQKEQLGKERQENDNMIRQQEMFRRQLSTFHLPHCPVLNSPPCPVHSRLLNYQEPTVVKDTDLFEDSKSITRDVNNFPDFPRFEGSLCSNIAKNIQLQAEGSCEDLFAVRDSSTPTPSLTSCDDVTNFTLLLTDNCQNRLREIQRSDVTQVQRNER
ncbi:uncharacterized protein LOC129003366 [Macrosteles quadrilineatus]|uniref:uncharacterized protein LOC129003366 n=1 Tax=Macrosteles quadrilineatus TaxID=74068 RepID=UPI0023E2894E|nr:uncharacterized protein LOC129003366 [Macrosteles quadrilineatus]